jgi:hypothetical protein
MPYVPSNLADVASSSNSGKPQFPDHVHYRCSSFLSDLLDDMTYEGKEVLEIDLYFGVNKEETRERRNREGWLHTDENVGTGDAGPILIDIEVHFMFKKETGKDIQTNFYTGEPAEYISTSTYEEILRDQAISAIKTVPEVEF